jgi:hypothetical protein
METDHSFDNLFDEAILSNLPIFYRFMTGLKTAEVAELRHNARFSACDKYRTDQYLNYCWHKPISSLDYFDKISKIEADE